MRTWFQQYTPRKRQDLEIAPISGHEPSQDHSGSNKQDYPDSEMDGWDWDEMEASSFKETTTTIKRPVKLPPQTGNNHEVEGGNRQNEYSDHEVDNLDWDVLEHPPDRDTKTKLDNTNQLPSSQTCEQRQAQWLLCQDKCGCKNSLPNLVEKPRIVKDYCLRNGKVDLISNKYIAAGEIAAVFGETSTVWDQDDVDEFDRIAIQHNTIRNAQQFEFYVSGNTSGNQSHFHIIPKEDAELALSMKIDPSLRHSLHDDDCFYYHSWRNNVPIAFATLSSLNRSIWKDEV